MTDTLANGYSSESTQREPSNEYQYDRVKMVFKNILLLGTKVASALEGLSLDVILLLPGTGIHMFQKNSLMGMFAKF